jgi:CheY-like chemotaxis protein
MSDLLHRSLGEMIEVETVLSARLWAVLADANQLESALLNLAVNARDAMAGGGKLTIETANAFIDEVYAASEEGVQPGQYVVIAVSDTGVGMPSEVVAKAFDPFFTTKEPWQGTGLGLSQVYGFVKQSGGHVKLYSEVGEGTTVKIYLPRLPVPGPTLAPEPVMAPEVGRGETVLIVEDHDDVRAFAADMLTSLGYSVVAASDAATALQALDQLPQLDLLFTDVGLPNGLNGRQLAEEVKRARPGVAVLFTTGYARNAIVHHGRLDSGVELLLKPYTQLDLARKLRHVLAGNPERTG